MKIKKITIILLALVMAAACFACGGGSDNSGGTDGNETEKPPVIDTSRDITDSVEMIKRVFTLCASLAVLLVLATLTFALVGTFSLTAQAANAVALDTKLKVYLIGRQSNATGLSERTHLKDADKEQVFDDVLIYIDGYDGCGGSVDAKFRKK